MLIITKVRLSSEIPLVGFELKLSVYVMLSGGPIINGGDITESRPVSGRFIRYNCTNIPDGTTRKRDGETWFEVGRSKTYTPTPNDIGHVLTCECVVVDLETRSYVGKIYTSSTSSVVPAPSPTPRRMISVSGTGLESRISSGVTFSVLSYNILSDAYAKAEIYGYCPSWALSWAYRKQNLLREIVGYHADIVCLQEVQSDHFDDFFSPEMEKHGYQAIFKKKTMKAFGGNMKTIDGCATFFRRDKFEHVRDFGFEFNEPAHSLIEPLVSSAQKNNAFNRLVKDNIAQIVVLAAKFSNQGIGNSGKQLSVCVTNTHINVHQDLTDVKLFQVHKLLAVLKAFVKIPMLVCGDFNSIPGSALHSLLAYGKVDPGHPDLAVDPLGILQPTSKLNHDLPLVSAYTSFGRAVLGLEHRRRIHPVTNEPRVTSYTEEFVGTCDYIFYSADSLMVESLLELLDERILRRNTALPCVEWSSDHIALAAEFRLITKN
ncbi:hypothetical protein MIMGU_mgv1a018036mg [Erythranthe guttata]|uniref:poly(A)-specific ribonuclease n=1 Tax=Erythranthe guttata TaxID=4155 RepID=A0A022RIH3_ERYGU|nr:hypothetical protein MIMGU_mgv1a018036mg [Erythranthe guttata]